MLARRIQRTMLNPARKALNVWARVATCVLVLTHIHALPEPGCVYEPANFLLLRAGDGTAALNRALPLELLEITFSGTIVSAVRLNSVPNATHPSCLLSDTGSRGRMRLSHDGTLASFLCYNASVGQSQSAMHDAARVVVTVDCMRRVRMDTVFTGVFQTVDSVVTDGVWAFIAGADALAVQRLGSATAPLALLTVDVNDVDLPDGTTVWYVPAGGPGARALQISGGAYSSVSVLLSGAYNSLHAVNASVSVLTDGSTWEVRRTGTTIASGSVGGTINAAGGRKLRRLSSGSALVAETMFAGDDEVIALEQLSLPTMVMTQDADVTRRPYLSVTGTPFILSRLEREVLPNNLVQNPSFEEPQLSFNTANTGTVSSWNVSCTTGGQPAGIATYFHTSTSATNRETAGGQVAVIRPSCSFSQSFSPSIPAARAELAFMVAVGAGAAGGTQVSLWARVMCVTSSSAIELTLAGTTFTRHQMTAECGGGRLTDIAFEVSPAQPHFLLLDDVVLNVTAPSPTPTVSATATRTWTRTASASSTSTRSPTITTTRSASSSATSSRTTEPSRTPTLTRTRSPSWTPSTTETPPASRSATESRTPESSASATGSVTQSESSTSSGHVTASTSVSKSPTASSSPTATSSPSSSATGSFSLSASPPGTISSFATATVTPSLTLSPSVSCSSSSSASGSATATPAQSFTTSATQSSASSATSSVTSEVTPTESAAQTATVSSSASGSVSFSPSSTATATPSGERSASASASTSWISSQSVTVTTQASPTVAPSTTVSTSPSFSATVSITPSSSASGLSKASPTSSRRPSAPEFNGSLPLTATILAPSWMQSAPPGAMRVMVVSPVLPPGRIRVALPGWPADIPMATATLRCDTHVAWAATHGVFAHVPEPYMSRDQLSADVEVYAKAVLATSAHDTSDLPSGRLRCTLAPTRMPSSGDIIWAEFSFTYFVVRSVWPAFSDIVHLASMDGRVRSSWNTLARRRSVTPSPTNISGVASVNCSADAGVEEAGRFTDVLTGTDDSIACYDGGCTTEVQSAERRTTFRLTLPAGAPVALRVQSCGNASLLDADRTLVHYAGIPPDTIPLSLRVARAAVQVVADARGEVGVAVVPGMEQLCGSNGAQCRASTLSVTARNSMATYACLQELATSGTMPGYCSGAPLLAASLTCPPACPPYEDLRMLLSELPIHIRVLETEPDYPTVLRIDFSRAVEVALQIAPGRTRFRALTSTPPVGFVSPCDEIPEEVLRALQSDPFMCTNASSATASACLYGNGATCVPCEAVSPGALCPGGITLWSRPGFWIASDASRTVTECRPPATERCPSFSEERMQTLCGVGYQQGSPGCTECADGYFPALTGACSRCPTGPPVLLLLQSVATILAAILGTALLTLAVVAALAKVYGGSVIGGARRTVQFMISLVAAVQAIVQVTKAAPATGLPSAVAALYEYFAVFQFGGVSIHPRCLSDVAFQQERVQFIIVLALLALLVLLWRPCATSDAGGQPYAGPEAPQAASLRATLSWPRRLRDGVSRACLTFLTLLYALVTNSALEGIVCTEQMVTVREYTMLDQDGSALSAQGLVEAHAAPSFGVAIQACDASPYSGACPAVLDLADTVIRINVLSSNPFYVCHESAHSGIFALAVATLCIYTGAFLVGGFGAVVVSIQCRKFTHMRATTASESGSSAFKEATSQPTIPGNGRRASRYNPLPVGVFVERKVAGPGAQFSHQHHQTTRLQSSQNGVHSAGEAALQPRRGSSAHSSIIANLAMAHTSETPPPPRGRSSALHAKGSTDTGTRSAAWYADTIARAGPGPLAYFLNGDYKPGAFYFRHLDMILLLSLSVLLALRRLLLHVTALAWSISTLAVSAGALVIVRPFAPEHTWQMPVKLATLLLSASSAVLNYVSAERASGRLDESAVLGLSYLVLAIAALLVVVVIVSFIGSFSFGARMEQEQANHAAAARAQKAEHDQGWANARLAHNPLHSPSVRRMSRRESTAPSPHEAAPGGASAIMMRRGTIVAGNPNAPNRTQFRPQTSRAALALISSSRPPALPADARLSLDAVNALKASDIATTLPSMGTPSPSNAASISTTSAKPAPTVVQTAVVVKSPLSSSVGKPTQSAVTPPAAMVKSALSRSAGRPTQPAVEPAVVVHPSQSPSAGKTDGHRNRMLMSSLASFQHPASVTRTSASVPAARLGARTRVHAVVHRKSVATDEPEPRESR